MTATIIIGVFGGLALIIFCLALLVTWLAVRTPVDRDEDQAEADLWVQQAVEASKPAPLTDFDKAYIQKEVRKVRGISS